MHWVMRLWITAAVLTGSAAAATYVVNPDGTGDFPTIQAAVDGVVDGDVIELGNGVFTGTGNRDVSYRGKVITIRSQGGAEACTIDCGGGPGSYHRAFAFVSGEGPGALLEGVTIRNGYRTYGGGVLCDGSSPLIRDCVFASNTACNDGDGGALYSGGAPHPTVIGCLFASNVAVLFGGAVCACTYMGETMMLKQCTFAGNRASQGGGLGI